MNDELARAVVVIKQGGVVAFPTETYYGLAVDPFNRQALERLFQIKQRPAAKPILTLIAELGQLPLLAADTPRLFSPLMAKYWPGPLTLVFPAISGLSSILTAGTGTVGVRISSHPVAQAMVQLAAMPITATSANISGRPPALNVLDIKEQFGDKVDLVVDGGSTPGGSGSTVVSCEQNGLMLLRQGVLPFACL